ncbi:MAG: hypothetical protein CBE26_00790 [Kiritimatiellaceae bacterium TMED266]|nr:MAG: hypothetical protein CBE26_00790 [Kiritimatiellaceae bacterium TMED266]
MLDMSRVFIVYSDWAFLKKIEAVISARSDLSLAGVYADEKNLVSALASTPPDLLLIDLDDNEQNRLGWIRQAVVQQPHLVTLVYAKEADDQCVFEAFQSGAYGFLLKEDIPGKLVESLEQVAAGGAPMSAVVARKVIQSFWKSKLYADVDYLSFREREILGLVSRGFTYAEIADEVSISPHTVHSHIKNIYGKLHVNGRKAALKKASLLGLIDTRNIPRTAG